MRHARSAFAVVEFLIVIVILAILAAIIIPRVTGHSAQHAADAMRADLATLARAESSYYAQHRQYTTDMGALGFRESPTIVVRIDSASMRGWSATATSRETPDTCMATSDTTTAAPRVMCRGAMTP